MFRRQLLALSGFLAAGTLAGCATDPETPPTTERSPGPGSEAPESPATSTPTDRFPTGTPGADDITIAELIAGCTAFALDLHSHLVRENGGNQFLSPYSISVALAMAYAGARGSTRTQMRETLRYSLGEGIHPGFAELMAELEARATTADPTGSGTIDAFVLAIANTLWVQEGFALESSYTSTLDQYYGTGIRRADFAGAAERERERINAWVAEATSDRITDLLPPGSITAQTALLLVNAIYFRAEWQRKFDSERTRPATFTALDGEEATVPMMRHESLKTNYVSVPGAEVVELEYLGGQVSMVLFLPDEGRFEAFERQLTAERLFGIFDTLEIAMGPIAMPKFDFETRVQLRDALSALGMSAAFGPGANFSGMVTEGSGPGIADVYHQANVSVDERGTEAAAATGVPLPVSGVMRSFDLTFDRPFLFCIRDKPTDAVLFLGRVVDAAEAQA